MSKRYLQVIAILFISLYLTGCAPAATQTVAPTLEPTASQTPAATQTPAPTATPTESPLQEGIVTNFEDLKVKLGSSLVDLENGKVTIKGAEGFIKELSNNAEGTGILVIDGKEFTYHYTDTIIVKSQDEIWVAGWKLIKNAETKKFKFAGAVEVLAQAPIDSEGKVVHPSTYLPHFNNEDSDLEFLHIIQTANSKVFDDGTLPTSKEGLRPDHYWFIDSKYKPGHTLVAPIPSGPVADRQRLMLNSQNAYPTWIETDKPARYINSLGVSFSTALLDQSGNTIMIKGIIPNNQYRDTYDALSIHEVSLYLRNKKINSDEVDNFLFENNSKLIKLASDNGNKIQSFSDKMQLILSSTYLIISLIPSG